MNPTSLSTGLMKVRITDEEVRMRLNAADRERLTQGLPSSTTTPMPTGDPLKIRLVLGETIEEPNIHAVHREIEFRVPLQGAMSEVLNGEKIGHFIDFENEGGLLRLIIERDLESASK